MSMHTRPATMIGVLLTLAIAGCGGANASDDVGRSRAAREAEPIELALRTPEGVFVDLGDLRGKPVVLFVFATFDTACQAATRPLARFQRTHVGDAHVIGVAVQPNAAELVGPWSQALGITFTVTYEPEPRILAGATDLGNIAGVPSYIVLDAEGLVVARHTGFASENKLARLLDAARPR